MEQYEFCLLKVAKLCSSSRNSVRIPQIRLLPVLSSFSEVLFHWVNRKQHRCIVPQSPAVIMGRVVLQLWQRLYHCEGRNGTSSELFCNVTYLSMF